jgi:hypothetical protein
MYSAHNDRIVGPSPHIHAHLPTVSIQCDPCSSHQISIYEYKNYSTQFFNRSIIATLFAQIQSKLTAFLIVDPMPYIKQNQIKWKIKHIQGKQ